MSHAPARLVRAVVDGTVVETSHVSFVRRARPSAARIT
ncbi:hypothetical protein CZ771_13655 [Actinomycetales bacterium JB111]|nr:hypothetical protein CZ771_13655 [Actinomycetales bacterium JB111]